MILYITNDQFGACIYIYLILAEGQGERDMYTESKRGSTTHSFIPQIPVMAGSQLVW